MSATRIGAARIGGTLLAAAVLATACAQQEAAVLVTVNGQFLVPGNADSLRLDVLENQQVFLTKTWSLTASTPLPVSVTLVESGNAHPHVKINAILSKDARVVGRGNIEADFRSGQTVQVAVDVLAQ